MNWNVSFITVSAVALMATLTGCDKMVGMSDATASVTSRAFHDTESTWSELFTYHPKVAPPLPQTRYCYQMQSDVVCYDSEQPTLTAKMVGYQDGDRQSFVQPGGGSLGVSGGAPIAYRQTTTAQMESQSVVSNDYNASTGPVSGSVGAGPSNSQISVNTLPPIQPRTK